LVIFCSIRFSCRQDDVLETNEVSVYDIRDHPDIKYRLGHIVVRVGGYKVNMNFQIFYTYWCHVVSFLIGLIKQFSEVIFKGYFMKVNFGQSSLVAVWFYSCCLIWILIYLKCLGLYQSYEESSLYVTYAVSEWPRQLC